MQMILSLYKLAGRSAGESTLKTPFTLGVMIRWQLGKILELGGRRPLALDATFGTNCRRQGWLYICRAQHQLLPARRAW